MPCYMLGYIICPWWRTQHVSMVGTQFWSRRISRTWVWMAGSDTPCGSGFVSFKYSNNVSQILRLNPHKTVPFSATTTTGNTQSCFVPSLIVGKHSEKELKQRDFRGRNSLIDTKAHMSKHTEYQSHTHTHTHSLSHSHTEGYTLAQCQTD